MTYNIQIDKNRKLLFVDLEGTINSEEALEATKLLWTRIASLGYNSIIICDVRKLSSGSGFSRIMLQKIMKLVDSYKPKLVIRITENNSAALLFEKAHANVNVTYKVVQVDTTSEAQSILNDLGIENE